MTQQEFLKRIASGRTDGVWLLHGEEEPMKQEALRRLKDALLDPGLAEMNCAVLDNPEPDRLIDACETVPVLSEKRLVIVRDFAGFRVKRGKGRDAEEDAEDAGEDRPAGNAGGGPVAAYLPELPMSTVLVFAETGRVNKTTALYKAIVKAGNEVVCDKLKGDALVSWVVERFRAEGKLCPRPTAQSLVFVSGTESSLLETEILKLCAYTGSREGVTEDDVQEAATRTSEYNVFRLLDCVVAGSEARALELLRLMLLSGEAPAAILAMLLRQYRLLQMVKIMQLERVAPEEIGRRTGLSSFPLKQYIGQAALVKGGEVKRGVALILDAEYAFKSGRLPEKGLVETVVLQLLALRHEFRGKQGQAAR